jgi:hypothetical protein
MARPLLFPAQREAVSECVHRRLLGIYLNDHLAGATMGLELARRALNENRGSPYGLFLEDLTREIADDRTALLNLMRSLGIAPSRIKTAAGWMIEKVGRLKLNGQIRGYSPLSRLLELEGIASGVDAKLALWQSLQSLERDGTLGERIDLETLVARARSQREHLERHRLAAAAEALRR